MTNFYENKTARNRLEAVTEETARVVRRWIKTPYYDEAEKHAQGQWHNVILPFLTPHTPDFENVLELAFGHGRMTQILLEQAGHLIGVDVLQENIDFCYRRFGDHPKLSLQKNDGVQLSTIEDETISFVFCFDSMVHFDSDVVRNYLAEFSRVMRPNALALLHHSNLTRNPGGDFQKNTHARNFMSSALFSHYAIKEGLTVIKQKVIDWGQVKELDCLSLLGRP